MTTLTRTTGAPATTVRRREHSMGALFMDYFTTTDHKKIGRLYFITSFIFFGIGGLMALAIRAELASPGMQYMTHETFNQMFTMHGTIMLLMFATPLSLVSPTTWSRCRSAPRTWPSRV